MDDQVAMRQALACARSVEGRTSPRPPVGAIVINNGRIVGRGATAPPYGPHAETQALEEAGEAARGSTLYVTLEPCCITVHTPPCTEAIIAAGVRRVVVGAYDPNPHVRRQGMKCLHEAGIEVLLWEEGREACEAAEILRPFASFITRGRPYVTAKWAMTLDGKIASYTGDSFWISRQDARSWVHDLRDRVDAVLIGAGTARRDNPSLTVRLTPAQRLWERTTRINSPLRVVMNARGDLPENLALFQPELASSTCVIVGERCSRDARRRLVDRGCEVLSVAPGASGQLDLCAALRLLGQRGIMHVLIEGGARLLGNAFDMRCLDHVAAFVCPKLVGGHGALSPLAGQGLAIMQQASQLHNVRTTQFEADILIEGDISE
ncbi:MAG TPA: bifunctional diaminohydroxyphosphoribosylaminopyrimidine deaminase/5-amino-6-(5-phosphoribosylamino)uracil reductase RibD [Ktedonobacteraceae bacterium]|nr:bifunctional diaminohydroxyphosphoribosylaminopyrimidine deaminase/5-amino-6-(5-phosphoribosylamino)uracil reductase RibD [Ktedonobacteraceae bacterium]